MRTDSVNVNETVNVPRGVRVTDSPPPDGEYVNLYKTRSRSWQAQHWTRIDDGQLIAIYEEERSAKRDALDDAFHIAQAEGIPFVRTVREESDAMYVESTVIE